MTTVSISSFGYKYGLPPESSSGYVFDCRALPNPYWEESLRRFTGCDAPIVDFMNAHADAVCAFMLPVRQLVQQSLRAYERDGRETLSVAFGCTGGQHRSVYCAEALAEFLRSCEDVNVKLVHAAQKWWKT